MNWNRGSGRRPTNRRAKVLAVGASAVLLGGAGGAWAAVGVDKEKPIQTAESFHLTVPAGQERTVSWTVGQVTFQATCGATEFPDDPVAPIHVGAGGGVTNKGPDRVRIVLDRGVPTSWFAPGEGTDVAFGPGEMVNEDTPEGRGEMHTFAVLDEHGESATGMWAGSFWADPAKHTGYCEFTLQAKG